MGQFRAKVKNNNSVISKRWAFGDRVTVQGKVYIVPDDARVLPLGYTDGPPCLEGFVEVIEASVGQNTGIEDRWTREVYEKDIAQYTYKDVTYIGVIIIRSGSWMLDHRMTNKEFNNGLLSLYHHRHIIEVIGNTTDNPKLLKK